MIITFCVSYEKELSLSKIFHVHRHWVITFLFLSAKILRNFNLNSRKTWIWLWLSWTTQFIARISPKIANLEKMSTDLLSPKETHFVLAQFFNNYIINNQHTTDPILTLQTAAVVDYKHYSTSSSSVKKISRVWRQSYAEVIT